MSMRQKRGRGEMHGGPMVDPSQHLPQVNEDAFIQDNDAVDSGDDDDDDDKPKGDKKAGRRKIKIEFIQDKSRRHITFSKRKAGIMKKAYELSTLTGTQVLLLVVSETGLVYTFTTAKLQPLVTQPEGKNLIQACLNAPHGTLPSAMPVGQPLGRAANPGPPMALPTGPAPAGTSGAPVPPPANISGGIPMQSQPPNDDDLADDDDRPQNKRRRRDGNSQAASRSGATSPHNNAPPPLSIPPTSASPPSAQGSANPPMGMAGSPTSPNQAHAQVGGGPYGGQYHPQQHQPPPQQQQRPDGSPVYGNQQMLPGGNYSYGGTSTQQPLGGLAAAAAQHQQWGGQPTPQQQHQQQQQQQQQQHVPQGASYGRR